MTIIRLLYYSRQQFVVASLAIVTTFFLLTSNLLLSYFLYNHSSAAYTKAVPASGGPTLKDSNLKVEVIFKGLDNPTSMAFLGPNDILVLEKNKGTVDRIVNSKMLKSPLLHVNNIATQVEHGMLGIAIQQKSTANINNGPTYVFLYYTTTTGGGSSSSSNGGGGGSSSNSAVANRLYRYELVNNKLVNPKLLLDLPAVPSPGGETNHNGGKVIIGPDHNVYTVIGDVGSHRGQAQNIKNGPAFDGTGGILRVTQDGQVASNPPLGAVASSSGASLNAYYYAYGIRNSFGIDFDPVTGKLWDTENGPTSADEINLVKAGFNSGWVKIMGLAKDAVLGKVNLAKDLVNINGKGIYQDPQFVWNQPVAPTALKFLKSDKLGIQYQNTIFVGDVDTGNLYNFKLNQQRTGLLLTGPLADKVANTPPELQNVILGKGFGVITDIQVGPDGYLYILNLQGSIYKISSTS
jgi:aldose sugar dehydrogenase